MSNKISQDELTTFWNIFSASTNGASHLGAEAAVRVLRNSKLPDDQLEAVWDLADFDSDGQFDFEEFCVAMKLTFQLVNGEISRVPKTLPDWLVPESKAHFVQASRALDNSGVSFSQSELSDDETEDVDLKDGFDWYVAPDDRHKYEQIYSANKSAHGDIAFGDLEPLYSSLDVPDTDIRSAWNLINPSAEETIGKDACLAFLHILKNRHEGYRIPRSVPASLRASFERTKVNYNVDRERKAPTAADRWGVTRDDDTITGRKAKFGDAYLSRLGIGDRSRAAKKTDFSAAPTTEDWEVVRLKSQLKEIEGQMKEIEEHKRKVKGGDKPKSGLVKRELELMLDHKQRELRDLDESDRAGPGGGADLNRVRDDIDSVRDQVQGLESHLRRRRDLLADLQEQIRQERA